MVEVCLEGGGDFNVGDEGVEECGDFVSDGEVLGECG